MLCVKIKGVDTWFASLSSITHSHKDIALGIAAGILSFLSLLLKSYTGKNNEGLNSPILLPIYLTSSRHQRGNTCFSNSIFADENFVQFHSLTSEFSQLMANSIPLPNKEKNLQACLEGKLRNLPQAPVSEKYKKEKNLLCQPLMLTCLMIGNLGKIFNIGQWNLSLPKCKL